MANAITYQTLIDGARNTIIKVTGVLDTSNMVETSVIDLSTLVPVPTQLRIDHIDYSVSDQLELRLRWDATTPVDIMPLAGRGRMSFWNFGGLQNNAGAGKTGKILLSTVGYASGIQVFSLILEMAKQGV
jgi:hypothetical protein